MADLVFTCYLLQDAPRVVMCMIGIKKKNNGRCSSLPYWGPFSVVGIFIRLGISLASSSATSPVLCLLWVTTGSFSYQCLLSCPLSCLFVFSARLLVNGKKMESIRQPFARPLCSLCICATSHVKHRLGCLGCPTPIEPIGRQLDTSVKGLPSFHCQTHMTCVGGQG